MTDDRTTDKAPAVYDKSADEIRFACECGHVTHIVCPDPFELLSLYQGGMLATCETCRRMSELELQEAPHCQYDKDGQAMSGICDMCARRECIGRDDARKQCDKYLVSKLLHICDNCAYFGPQLDHGQEIECADDGACRKNPPTVIPTDDDGGFAAIFPPMNREDWCGGWKEIGE